MAENGDAAKKEATEAGEVAEPGKEGNNIEDVWTTTHTINKGMTSKQKILHIFLPIKVFQEREL